jgi:hypothetical protein
MVEPQWLDGKPDEESVVDTTEEDVAEPEVAEEPEIAVETEEKHRKSGSAKQKERAQRLQAELDATKAQLEQVTRMQQQPAPVQTGKPDINDPKYATLDDYYTDLADYQADLKVQGLKMEMQAYAAQQAAQQAQQDWQNRCAKTAETKPDWDDAVAEFNYFANELDRYAPAVTQAAGSAIRDSEIGPELVHYLGTHPEEIKKFASMSPFAAVREIGRLEERLQTKLNPKPQSNAPKPPTPAKGGTFTPSKDVKFPMY